MIKKDDKKKPVKKAPAKKKATNKKTGAPTKYNKTMCAKVFKLAASGLYNPAIATRMGISTATLHNYMNLYPDFLEAIQGGRELADAKVENVLYKMAMGYKHTVEKPVVVSDGVEGSHVETVKYEVDVPPNFSAISFHLRNRKPKEWRDKQEIGLTGKDGEDRSFSVVFGRGKDTEDKGE